MKCRCCISLRSAVYFGASIHIFLGLLLFGKFALHSAVFLYRYFTLDKDQQTSLTLLPFLSMLVDATFMPLGCMIFRGVERESLRLIKWPTILFSLLKLLKACIQLYSLYMVHITPEKRLDLDTFIYQGIDLVGTALYILILACYCSRLRRIARDYESDYGEQYDYYDPPTEHSLTMNSSKLLNTAADPIERENAE